MVPYKQKYKDAIESVQRRATKQLPGMKDIPYEERLKRLKLPTLVSVNSFKNRLDRHWSTEEFLYNYKETLPGSRRAFQGKVEDLTTEATAYGQEPK